MFSRFFFMILFSIQGELYLSTACWFSKLINFLVSVLLLCASPFWRAKQSSEGILNWLGCAGFGCFVHSVYGCKKDTRRTSKFKWWDWLWWFGSWFQKSRWKVTGEKCLAVCSGGHARSLFYMHGKYGVRKMSQARCGWSEMAKWHKVPYHIIIYLSEMSLHLN